MPHRKRIGLMLVGCLLLATPAAAQFNLGVGAGVNICTANGSAHCGQIQPGDHWWAIMEYRFGGLIGWSFEYDAGTYSASGIGANLVHHDSSHVTSMLRTYFDCGDWEAYGGIGMGITNLSVSDTVTEETITSFETLWATVKVSLGALRPSTIVDDLDWGLRIDQFFHLAGDACVIVAGAQDCQDIEDTEVAGQLQLGLDIRYVF